MFIRSKVVLGETSLDGRSPIWPGEVAEVDDEVGQRVVDAGYAVEWYRPAAVEASNRPATKTMGENQPEGSDARNRPENAGKGQVTGHLDEAQLQGMSYTDLKALAKDMGIETGKIKSKAGMIAAITAVEVEAPDDDLPELTPQDVVDA